jgi:hypothetical protein
MIFSTDVGSMLKIGANCKSIFLDCGDICRVICHIGDTVLLACPKGHGVSWEAKEYRDNSLRKTKVNTSTQLQFNSYQGNLQTIKYWSDLKEEI